MNLDDNRISFGIYEATMASMNQPLVKDSQGVYDRYDSA